MCGPEAGKLLTECECLMKFNDLTMSISVLSFHSSAVFRAFFLVISRCDVTHNRYPAAVPLLVRCRWKISTACGDLSWAFALILELKVELESSLRLICPSIWFLSRQVALTLLLLKRWSQGCLLIVILGPVRPVPISWEVSLILSHLCLLRKAPCCQSEVKIQYGGSEDVGNFNDRINSSIQSSFMCSSIHDWCLLFVEFILILLWCPFLVPCFLCLCLHVSTVWLWTWR